VGERRKSTQQQQRHARSERSGLQARWFAKSIATWLRDRLSPGERIVDKLLDPDFWMTLGRELLDSDFWATMWRKLLDAELWRTVWRAFSAPEVAIPLIPLLLIALYIGRKTKGRFDAGKIKDMEAQIEVANQRMLLAREQRAAGADVERELNTLRKQVVDLKMLIEAGAQHKELATTVGAVAQTLAKLSSANDELQRKFIQRGPSNKPEPHPADKR
jgi:hypothetical protein